MALVKFFKFNLDIIKSLYTLSNTFHMTLNKQQMILYVYAVVSLSVQINFTKIKQKKKVFFFASVPIGCA